MLGHHALKSSDLSRFAFSVTGAEVELATGERLRCKAVIGADGVKSRIAAKLGVKPATYAGEVYYRWDCSLQSLLPCMHGLHDLMRTGRPAFSDRQACRTLVIKQLKTTRPM